MTNEYDENEEAEGALTDGDFWGDWSD